MHLPCRPVVDSDTASVDSNGRDGERGNDEEDALERRLELAKDGVVSPLPSLKHNFNLKIKQKFKLTRVVLWLVTALY